MISGASVYYRKDYNKVSYVHRSPRQSRCCCCTSRPCPLSVVSSFFVCVYFYFMYITLRYRPDPETVCPMETENATYFPSLISSDDILKFEQGYGFADDTNLIRYIRYRWIIGPSTKRYNISDNLGSIFSQRRQADFVYRILNKRRLGFFLEYGVFDGDTFSKSLFLEREQNWTGLVIEPNPWYFSELLVKHRRCFAINACISTTNKTEKVKINTLTTSKSVDGTFWKNVHKVETQQDISVQCFPLYSVLLALKTTYVDYMSFNFFEPALPVLETVPLHVIYVELISVNYRYPGDKKINKESMDKLRTIRNFFNRTNLYHEVGIIPWKEGLVTRDAELRGTDVFFKRKPY